MISSGFHEGCDVMELPETIVTQRPIIRPFQGKDSDLYLEFMTGGQATRCLMLTDDQGTEAGARALFEALRQPYRTMNCTSKPPGKPGKPGK